MWLRTSSQTSDSSSSPLQDNFSQINTDKAMSPNQYAQAPELSLRLWSIYVHVTNMASKVKAIIKGLVQLHLLSDFWRFNLKALNLNVKAVTLNL